MHSGCLTRVPIAVLVRPSSSLFRRSLPPGLRVGAMLGILVAGLGCGKGDAPAAPGPAAGSRGTGASAPAPAEAPSRPTGHERMLALLRAVAERTDDENPWVGDREARELREMAETMTASAPLPGRWMVRVRLGVSEGWLGNFEEATRHLSAAHALLPRVQEELSPEALYQFYLGAGLVWLRLGEVQNCCARNTAESCILPLRGGALHVAPEGSRRALDYLTVLAERFPDRLTPRWLLNLAYMTLGEYPDKVPAKHRIPPAVFESKGDFPRFANIAREAGLGLLSLAGSVVVEDFDRDEWLDVVVSSWDPRAQLRFFRNNGDGTFTERTAEAGLTGVLGGANMVQGDYDNDGHVDLLVLRGTWLGREGRHPNSLLRNQGDGTFKDVTFEAGLGEVHYPTETAGWADFDNDGHLDLYVGNEHEEGVDAPGQLFRNNRDGTFSDVAYRAGVLNHRYAKGVSWGDYDGDGFEDLYIANLRGGGNRLYRNNKDGTFRDVAPKLGVVRPLSSYPCWFWDFDNDGNLDLYVASYQGGMEAVAAGYLGAPLPPGTELPQLYRGDGRGGFQEVTAAQGLRRPVMAMGANFGDLDNDGFLDFYLGTGYPEYEALMPNVMFRNQGGERFVDVTFPGGFGHLQKGHGVAFADFDNDGDQDVFEQMGGAFRGDGAYFALYRNPGFSHHWLKLRLVGVKSNRSAFGARIRLVISDDGPRRTIHRHVSSGGSFGANPLRLEIGLGNARKVELLEVTWPVSGLVQAFSEVEVDQLLEITEGRDSFNKVSLTPPRSKSGK